jgi:hypothetical protein
MARMQRSLFAQLNALAEEISSSSIKAAAEKSAGPTPADPGGYQGSSSHPSASVDNNVQKAEEGARSSEYEADIKKQQGAVSVNSAPELSQEGRQDDVQLNIGTNAAATGEDPAAEKDYKGTKDDPGTAHPAKTNDGEKYSSVTFKQARQQCSALGNDILANLINFGTSKLTGEKAAEMPAFIQEKIDAKKDNAGESDKHEASESPAAEKAEHSGLKGDQHKLDVDNDGKIEGSDLASLRAGKDKEAAFKAGYELAAAAGLNKEAAEAAVREVCANTLRDADTMADLVIGFLSTKQAGGDTDDALEGEDHSSPDDVSSGASDAPPTADAGAGDPSMGGEDPAAMAGGDPAMAGAGAPSEEEAVQELAMALQELGIPPEALLQAVAGGQGGGDPAMGGAGAPPMADMAGGAPPEMAPKMAAAKELTTIGHAVVNFKRAGKFEIKEARTKRSRQLRDMMKQHVLELVNR